MIRFVLILLGLLLAVPAQAEVSVTFYSRDFGEMFPHAYFGVSGTLADGAAVPDTNYGFTPKTISPAMLFGSVAGEVMAVNATYIRKSNAHFTLRLNDEQYRRLMAVVNDWSSRPGKSYNLDRANCVTFVAEALKSLGIRVNPKSEFMKKPHSFLSEVSALNPQLQGK